MTQTDITGLVRDLLEWVARAPRSYADAQLAWRTSCPRLPVWEEATGQGLLACLRRADGVVMVEVTALGRRLLEHHPA